MAVRQARAVCVNVWDPFRPLHASQGESAVVTLGIPPDSIAQLSMSFNQGTDLSDGAQKSVKWILSIGFSRNWTDFRQSEDTVPARRLTCFFRAGNRNRYRCPS